MYYDEFETILGKIVVVCGKNGLEMVHIQSGGSGEKFVLPEGCVRNEEALSDVKKQILEYLDGKRKDFALCLNPQGSSFVLKVLGELRKIPFGQTLSYGEVAENIGMPKAGRAVGTACGKNPLAIVIPCHRVIAAGNKIGGFASGLAVKRKLLQLEGIEIDN